MPEEVTPQGQEPEEAAETKTPEGESPEEVEGSGTQEKSKEEPSPLWEGIDEDHPVRKEVEKLRKEAADRRTTAQQIKQENEALKGQLEKAKTPEEYQELMDNYEAKVHALESTALRSQVASEFRLPNDLAELLKGDDEEALKAHAEKLSQYVPKGQTPSGGNPRGGKNPNMDVIDVESTLETIRRNRQ